MRTVTRQGTTRQAGARLLVVWCPDWPVVAAGIAEGLPVHSPIAVVHANRVVACSATARRHGVRRDTRRREAQYRCPELVVVGSDPGREARIFEQVAAAVERLAPGIEVVRPGVVAVPARGPARAFGGEQQAAERMVEHVATETGVECQVGIADGLFAAFHAARTGRIVASAQTAEFLAPLPIADITAPLHELPPADEKERGDLVDLLRRLGIRTLGMLAGLPEREVYSRFGTDALRMHQLAGGRQHRPAVRRTIPPELVVSQEFDPPLDRVHTVAFAARRLAGRLHAELTRHDLACTRLVVHARTAHGEQLARAWRCATPLTEDAITDRVRWQLEGWLRTASSAPTASPAPTAGIGTITLEPAETVGGQALQSGLWRGAEVDELGAERANRALLRAQALLDPAAVGTPVVRGGRSAAEQIQLVPWGDERTPATPPDRPWPGRIPSPAPATVPVAPIPVALLTELGAPITMDGPFELSAIPYYLVRENEKPFTVHSWAGPWPMQQRWWSADTRRQARLQVVCGADRTGTDGEDRPAQGFLLVCGSSQWAIEGVYD